MSKLKFCMSFPNFVQAGTLRHHKLFNDFREWLESVVGVQKIDWDYITGDIHARGICFKRKEDLTAFVLKFKI
jgi:hypothetical protein